jgi:hypothetical protein
MLDSEVKGALGAFEERISAEFALGALAPLAVGLERFNTPEVYFLGVT